jgi:5-methylcytosine-specific restriction endonuclease McrA
MNVPIEIWEKVFRRDNGRCRYCGLDLLQSYSTFASATVDHLIARSVGGTDAPRNLVLACPGCNQMLSRAGDLRTFAKRKALLVQRWREHDGWYQPFLKVLRNEKAS